MPIISEMARRVVAARILLVPSPEPMGRSTAVLIFDSAAHLTQNVGQGDAGFEQAGHRESSSGNGEWIAGAGGLQDLLAGTVLGDACFAAGIAPQDRLVQPPDGGPDGV